MPSCSLKPCQNWGGQYPGMGGQYHRNMHTDIQTEYQFDSSELNPENKPIFVGLSVLISEFETTTYFFGRMVTPQNTTDWVLMKEVYNKDRGTTRYAEYVQLPNKDSYFEMVAIVKYKNHSFETETKRFDHTYEGNLFVVHGAP